MPGLARIGEDTGSSQLLVSGPGSATVFCNGQPAGQLGTLNARGTAIVGGSTNVFINGNPAATGGTGLADGGVVDSCSTNVFVN